MIIFAIILIVYISRVIPILFFIVIPTKIVLQDISSSILKNSSSSCS